MLNMLDDCSRVFVGSKLYGRELLLSYLDFLPAAFLSYGRPLQIYVDYHAMFFSQNPEALTQLGAALRFYDISFLYAPHPKPREKSSASTNSGRAGFPPISPANRLPNSTSPTPISTLCDSIVTPTKPIANCT